MSRSLFLSIIIPSSWSSIHPLPDNSHSREPWGHAVVSSLLALFMVYLCQRKRSSFFPALSALQSSLHCSSIQLIFYIKSTIPPIFSYQPVLQSISHPVIPFLNSQLSLTVSSSSILMFIKTSLPIALYLLYSIPGRSKTGPLCFMVYNFSHIEQIFTKFGTKSLHSEHHAITYLDQLWKIVTPSGEWRWHFYNNKFWIGDHFLTSFRSTCY